MVESMKESHQHLAGFVTELKMEHQDGQKKSDKLDTFLGGNMNRANW